MPNLTDGSIRLPQHGITVMPTDGLHAHTEREGWQRATDEITERLAALEAAWSRQPELRTGLPG